jgi:hypothetical protein
MAYDSFDCEIDKFRSFALGFLPLSWCFPFGSDLVPSCPLNVVLGHCGLSHGALSRIGSGSGGLGRVILACNRSQQRAGIKGQCGGFRLPQR